MNETMEQQAGTDLIVSGAITAVVAFAPGTPAKLLEKIEREAREKAATLDASTEAGRKGLASLALKVAKTKTAYDGMGKDLVEERKSQAKVIDTERRVIRERLDALRDEIEAPVEAFKQRERDRVAAHEEALAAITEAPGYGQMEAAREISRRLDHLRDYPLRDWQEFQTRADIALTTEIVRTERLLAEAIKREAEAAELAAFRAKQAEEARLEAIRAQEARERQIAAEAAERARKEAERKAQAEREAIERQKQEAEQTAQRAQEAAERAERDRAAAVAKAEADAKAQAARAEAARVAAAQKAERDQQAAIEAERLRVAQEAAKAKAAEDKRARNVAHRKAINNEALADLVAAGLTEEVGKLVIGAIAKGAVRHISVRY